MSNRISFVEMCIQGTALPDEVDAFVARWHDGEDGKDISLRSYLGMTSQEYAYWLQDSHALFGIIDAHRRGRELMAYNDDYFELPLAARAASAEEAKDLTLWLKKIGKIS